MFERIARGEIDRRILMLANYEVGQRAMRFDRNLILALSKAFVVSPKKKLERLIRRLLDTLLQRSKETERVYRIRRSSPFHRPHDLRSIPHFPVFLSLEGAFDPDCAAGPILAFMREKPAAFPPRGSGGRHSCSALPIVPIVFAEAAGV